MILKEEILNAQKKWGEGVITIGSLKENTKECEIFTNKFIKNLYWFGESPVLFKPTKCAIEQFRPTQPKALSYFIAGEKRACSEDMGFALQPWTKVRFENSSLILEENRAIAMGNYYFTDLNGSEVKVEYTFGYKLISGELKIDVHHSSFPYNPNVVV